VLYRLSYACNTIACNSLQHSTHSGDTCPTSYGELRGSLRIEREKARGYRRRGQPLLSMRRPGAHSSRVAHTDPIDVFRAAVAALRREVWIGVAALCDAVSLRAFQRQLFKGFSPSVPPRPLTADGRSTRGVPSAQ
jgi:hypothetical protein